jgi:transposase
MSSVDSLPLLFDELGEGEDGGDQRRIVINRCLSFTDERDVRVVFYWHEPIFRFALSDQLTLRHVAVSLRLGSLATQEEISKAFGHSVATQRRWEGSYQADGVEGLANGKSSGRPSGVPRALEGVLRKWFAEGVTNREMAARLRVSEATIHRALSRLGLHRRKRRDSRLPFSEEPAEAGQVNHAKDEHVEMDKATVEGREGQGASLETDIVASKECRVEVYCKKCGLVDGEKPNELNGGVGRDLEGKQHAEPACQQESVNAGGDGVRWQPLMGERLEDVLAEWEEQGFTIDRDPDNRVQDRGLARVGLLDDATPLFADRPCLRQAGVLLAIPLLVQSGLLEVFVKVYHSLAPAFYGLRTTVVVLFLAALLRIKRPEHFKEYNPQELGHVIGLDRGPEVKTIRRKLEQLAGWRKAREAMQAMAQRRIEEDPERVAFLYVDGHVREYHGQYPLAKSKKSQHQVAKPAATDNWVHDANGEPLLVVTSEMNESLTQVLEPILTDVKRLVGDDRRPLVIFDRGGFSPKLFVRLDALGFDVMTYRKGRIRPWPVSHFTEEELVMDERRYRYRLAERERVRVGRLRPKRKKECSALGPQFLWMREVRVLRADGRQTSILTTRNELEKAEVAYRQFNRWRQENYFKYMDAEFELDALVEYGVEEVSPEADRPNPARRPLERQLAAARARVQKLQAQLGELVESSGSSPQRTLRGFKIAHAKLRAELAEAEEEMGRVKTELSDLPKRIPANDVKTLKTEKKLIVDTIKMTAYQVETDLLRLLTKHYVRSDDEGRTLLQAAFQSTARLEVREKELYVELAPQSSPHRTAAIQALCTELNALGAKFPGTGLRLNLAVRPPEPLMNG